MLAREAAEQLAHLDDLHRVEAGDRLVEHQQPRPWTMAWAMPTRCLKPCDSEEIGSSALGEIGQLLYGPARASRRRRSDPAQARREVSGTRGRVISA